MTSFIQRFHTKLSAVQAMGSKAQHGLTQFKLALLFVQKLEKGVANTDQRVLVLGYKSLLQKYTDVTNPPVSLTTMQSELTELESIVCKVCGSTAHTTRFCPKKSGRVTQNANATTNSGPPGRKNPIKCFKCGEHHMLRNCPKATQEEKDRLYSQKISKQSSLHKFNIQHDLHRTTTPPKPSTQSTTS